MAETLQQKLSRLAKGKYQSWQERRQHETGAIHLPSEFMWLNPKGFEDYYPRDTMKDIIKTSSRYKVDPNDLLAIGIAESGLGYKNPNNPMHIFLDAHEGNLRTRYPQLQGLKIEELTKHPAFPKISIDFAGELLSKAFKKYPKDRLAALQAYSGEGSTLYGGRAKEEVFFGKPVSKTNYWKEKPQGKRVDQISWWLRTNEALQQMINEVY